MRCKYCDSTNLKVTNSRKDIEAPCNLIRRTRKCQDCGKSFTTIEIPYSSIETMFKVYDGTSELLKMSIFGVNYRHKIRSYDSCKDPDEQKTPEETQEEKADDV